MVSICIPVYNSSRYLAAALDSALAQQYDNFEILVIDDCSSDGSSIIAEQYAAKHPNIRFVANPENIGMVANWNKCISLATGEYIKFLFGDDLLSSPQNLARLAGALDRNPDVALSCSFRYLVNQDNKKLAERGPTPTNRIVQGSQVIQDCLTAARNFVGEPTVVMFRKCQALRGFDPSYSQMVDLEMWFHLLLQGDLWCEREPLASFRLHEEQQTVINVGALIHLEEMLRLYGTYLHGCKLRLTPLLEKALYYVQCYRVWKGYRQQGVLTQQYAEDVIGRYISVEEFKKYIPAYKMLNPLWKFALSLRRHNPLTK